MPPGGQLVLPIMIAPAARMRATTVASFSGTFVLSFCKPAVVTTPAVSKMSLTVNGTPCRGPTEPPRATWRSAARACTNALWPSVRTTAFSLGLTAPICSRCALTTSSEETRPVRIALASHVAEAPMTFLRRRDLLLGISDHVAGFDVEHLDAGSDQALQVCRAARQRRESAEADRHHGLLAQEGAPPRGTTR